MNILSAASAAVLAVAGSLAALAARYASLCGIELVRGASFMGRLATFAATVARQELQHRFDLALGGLPVLASHGEPV